MKQSHWVYLLTSFVLVLLVVSGSPVDAESPAFTSMFNGTDLQGWKGLDSLWSVQEGAIVGQTTDKDPIKANTFLVWQGGEVGDFEFRCKVRFDASNSGVQYRSVMRDPAFFSLAGYQADLHPKSEYMGMMYGEQTGRHIIATGGQKVLISSNGKKELTGKFDSIQKPLINQWNEIRIIAVGNRMIHQFNGVTTVDVTDNHVEAKLRGLIGLQLHRGPAMKAEFRDLQIRELSDTAAAKALISEVSQHESLGNEQR